jgi:hypothetical protein
MEEIVLKPVNVAGAILIVQVCLLAMMTGGLWVYMNQKNMLNVGKQFFTLLILAIISIVSVAFITDFYPIWSPILGPNEIPTIDRNNAFAVLFFFDIAITWKLISTTGGSKDSPFTPILFLIPALAIFLREPPIRFIIYAIVVYIIYYTASYKKTASINLFHEADDNVASAHRFVNFTCLALSVIIGFITRPIPV